ncbi:MAG: ATP-grasp domain-containing protein [Phycisphaerae bacterium]|jgi:carbamoyl-phosphate synthase large subunit|nr:ATP-grasp domain-containing protein [Phycisphaerae bacterium]
MKSGKYVKASAIDAKVNILFTCVGRRVALVQTFRRAAEKLGLSCMTVGTDVNPLSPALYICDRSVVTLPVTAQGYMAELLSVIKKNKIDLVIPTIDPELGILARHREEIEALGARVMISSSRVIDICQDKRLAYHFMKEHHFDTPWTAEISEVRADKLKYPVFLKPWDGSASRSNACARDRDELKTLSKTIPNCIVQEFISGQEYTCDVYVDFSGKVRCVVPRRRLEIRSGEVSKSQTVKMPKMMEACRRLVEHLGAGPGVVTLQCFLTDRNDIRFIEINPRFGGGVPLSIQAGADFPRWILSEWMSKKPRITFDGWRDSLYMLRYDEAVWVSASRMARITGQ